MFLVKQHDIVACHTLLTPVMFIRVVPMTGPHGFYIFTDYQLDQEENKTEEVAAIIRSSPYVCGHWIDFHEKAQQRTC